MASTAALELIVRLKDQASKDMEKLAARGGKLEGVFGGLTKGAALAGAGVLSLGVAFAGAVKAAADEETGIARLNQTLKNSIPNWDGNTDAVNAYIKKQQKLAYSDDELRDSLNDLVIQTGDLQKAQELQTTAMDLARAKGIDLQTATKLVGKVNAENIGILKRYGITIDDNATKEEALAAIRKAAGGQAEAYARTTEGALTRIKNAFGDMVEDVGGVGLPVVGEALNKVADFMESDAFQGTVTRVLDTVSEGFASLGRFVGNAKRAFDDITSPLKDAADRLKDIGGILKNSILPGLKDVFEGNFDSASERLKNGFNGIKNAIGDALPNLKEFGGKLAGAFSGIDFTAAGSAIATGLVNAFVFVQEHKTQIADKLKELFSGAFQALKSQLPTVLDEHAPEIGGSIAGLFTKAITGSNIAGIAAGIIAPGLIEKAPEMIAGAWKWVQGAVAAAPQVLPALTAAIRTFITDVGLPAIKLAFDQWIGPAWNWAVDAAGKVAEKAGPILEGIKNWAINEAAPAIASAVSSWAGAIWSWIAGATDKVPTHMAAYMAAIRTWAQQVGDQTMNTIGSGFANQFQTGISKVGSIMQVDVPLAISKGFTEITRIINNAFSTIKTTIDGFTPDLSALTAKWSVDGALGIAGGFAQILTTVLNAWPAISNAVKGGASGAAGNLLGGFFSTLGSFWEKWNLFWTQVKNELANRIWSMFLAESKKIGDGFASGILDGIKGAWSKVVQWVIQKLHDLIVSVKQVFDIHSPSQVMADEVGKPIAEGIGEGFKTEFDKQSTSMVAAVKKLCDDDILVPIRKLTDNDVPPLIKKLTDDDILAPIRKLCDDDIPTALAAGVEAVRKFCDDDLPNATSSAGADAMKQIWSDVTAAFLSDIDAMRVAYQALQYELANGVSVGTTTVYNGSNGVPPGGGSNYGVGGHTQGGGHNAYAAGGRFPANRTMLVGERGPELLVPSQSGTIIPNHRLGGGINIRIGSIVAGPGTNGAQFASEFVDELEYLVAHRAFTRNPSLARAG